MARALTPILVSPVLTAPQLPPPSVLLNMPRKRVPAYRVVGVVGTTASALITSLLSPLLIQVLGAVDVDSTVMAARLSTRASSPFAAASGSREALVSVGRA